MFLPSIKKGCGGFVTCYIYTSYFVEDLTESAHNASKSIIDWVTLPVDIYFLTVLEARILKPGSLGICFLLRLLFLACRYPPSFCFLQVRKEKERLFDGISSYMNTNTTLRGSYFVT